MTKKQVTNVMLEQNLDKAVRLLTAFVEDPPEIPDDENSAMCKYCFARYGTRHKLDCPVRRATVFVREMNIRGFGTEES